MSAHLRRCVIAQQCVTAGKPCGLASVLCSAVRWLHYVQVFGKRRGYQLKWPLLLNKCVQPVTFCNLPAVYPFLQLNFVKPACVSATLRCSVGVATCISELYIEALKAFTINLSIHEIAS